MLETGIVSDQVYRIAVYSIAQPSSQMLLSFADKLRTDPLYFQHPDPLATWKWLVDAVNREKQ